MNLSADTTGNSTVVTVTGDIDMSTAGDFSSHLTRTVDDGTRVLIVDVSQVDFLDSSALAALIGVHKHLSRAGGSMRIVCDNPRTERVFEITRLGAVIPIFETLEAAHKPE